MPTSGGLNIPVNLEITASGLSAIEAEVKQKIQAINRHVLGAGGGTSAAPDINAAFAELRANAERALGSSPGSQGVLRGIGLQNYVTTSALAGQGAVPPAAGAAAAQQKMVEAIEARTEALLADTELTYRMANLDEVEGAAYVEAKAANIEAQHELAAVVQEQVAAAGIVAQSDAALGAAKARIAAQTAEIQAAELAGDDAYIASTVAAAASRELLAAKTAVIAAGESVLDVSGKELASAQLIARAAVIKRVQAEVKSAATLEAMTAEDIADEVRARAAKAQVVRANNLLARQVLQQEASQGNLGGTFYQRLTSQLSQSGKLPTENQTFPQAIGTKLQNTLGYAISGGAIFGAIFGIGKLIKDAEQLEQVFTRLDAQLTAAGQGDKFAGLRHDIIAVSEETGVSADKVGTAFARFQGAFHDSDVALQATSEAMKLMVVTGNDLDTTIQDVIATTKGFGVTTDELGNIVVDVSERFGVAAGGLERFLGQTAAVAKEAGLSLRDTAVIGAHAAQQLGQSPDAEAATFDRVLAQVGQFKENILAVYATTPALEKNLAGISSAFSKGETGTALKDFIRDFNQLGKGEQQDLIAKIGGKRGATFLTGLLNDSTTLTAELNQTDTSAGKLDQRFTSLQDTLRNVGQRLSAVFHELGDALLQAGVGQLFESIGIAIGGAVRGVVLLLQAFRSLDDATKFISNLFANLASFGQLGEIFPGFLTTFAQIAIVAALATKAINFTRESLLGVRGASSEIAQASAKEGTTTAIRAKSAALEQESAANETNTGAITTNVAAEEAQTAAKTEGAAATLGSGGVLAANQSRVQAAIEAERLASLPPPPGALASGSRFFGGGGLGTKLFQGGTVLKSAQADAAQVAATGSAEGASSAGIAGLAIAGAVIAGQKYFEYRGDVAKSADDLFAKTKDKDAAKLQSALKAYQDNESLLDKASIFFSGAESPAAVLERGINRTNASSGITLISGAQGSGRLTELLQKANDDSISKINDIINTSDETKKAFLEAGGQLNESGVDRYKNLEGKLLGDKDQVSYGTANVSRDELAKILPALKDKAENGDAAAADAVNRIETTLGKQADIIALVNELEGKGKTDAAIAAAGGGVNYAGITTAEAKSRLDSGEISLQTYIDTAKRNLDIAKSANDHSPDSQAKVDQLAADFQKQMITQVKQIADQRAANAELTGTSPLDAEIASLREQVNSPDNPGAAKLALLPTLVQKAREKFKHDLDQITDPEKRLEEAKKGYALTPEVQQESVARQLADNPAAATGLTTLAQTLGAAYQDLNQQVAEEFVRTGKSIKDIEVEIIDKKFAELGVRMEQENKAGDTAGFDKDNQQQQALQALRQQILSGANIDVTKLDRGSLGPDEFRQLQIAATQAVRARLSAAADLVKAADEGNPVAAAQDAVKQLEDDLAVVEADPNAAVGEADRIRAALIRAQTTVANSLRDVARAQLELAVGGSRNPVGQAQAQIILAQFDAVTAAAKGDAAGEARAAIALRQGQFALSDAQNDIGRARLEAAGAGLRDPVDQARQALRLAQYDQAVARAKGDTAGELRAGIAIQQAQQQIGDSEQERVKALLGLDQAKTRDPVAQARIAQQLADVAAANAHSIVDQINAQAARVQADHQMADALEAIASAQANLVIAVANAAGDSVGAANAGLSEARRKLQAAIATGAGDAAIADAQISVVQQQAALRDAQFNKSLGDIEFASQIGNITTAQEIEMLQALASVPGHTQDQVRQIQLKIKQLQQSLAQDFQFNLPTNIDIAGLFYQANRVNQSKGLGVGYQDNRNVTATVMVNGAQDPAATGAAVVAAINGAGSAGNQFAPGPRRYP